MSRSIACAGMSAGTGLPLIATALLVARALLRCARQASCEVQSRSWPAICACIRVVSYDLGRPREIRAAQLQADHNDVYLVDNDLHRQGRYVRVRARGGDGGFLVSELLLFGAPRGAPAEVERRAAVPLDRRLRDRTLLFGLFLLVPLLLPPRGGWRRGRAR